MMKYTNTFKDKSTKIFIPSILYALTLISLFCIYFFSNSNSFGSPLIKLTEIRTLHSENERQFFIKEKEKPYENSCDYFNGNWVQYNKGPLYNGSCFDIKPSQNCIVNGRNVTNYLYWRWKPNECNLPNFKPKKFLKLIKNMNIAFVGDSLSHNQITSLICLLSTISQPKRFYHGDMIKWYFPSHNATLSFYWSPFLVKGLQRNRGDTKSNKIYLDLEDEIWASDIDKMDMIVLSFGHWFIVPSIYYEGDSVLGCYKCDDFKSNYSSIELYGPMRKALRNSLSSIIERKVKKGKLGIDVIVRTFSPSHFEGGWDKGGTCSKNKPYRNDEKNIEGEDAMIRNIAIEEVEYAKVKGKEFGLNIKVLDVTKLALLRPDGHAGAYTKPFPFANGVPKNVQNDCIHWCLPGAIDTWNEIFLEMIKGKNFQQREK